jgi:hypothetical protein
MAGILGFEPRPELLESYMLPLTPYPYKMVGTARFERAVSASQTQRDNQTSLYPDGRKLRI